MTTYLFPELEDRRVKNGDRIRLSSLRMVQRALHRMWEDSGYWHGYGYIDKTTEENVFISHSWHIVATSGNTITITPVDSNTDCRSMGMFSYSKQGEYVSEEEGSVNNSRIHGSRSGCIAPGDRLQISFPSLWERAHNAVIRMIEFVGNNSLRLTLDRATTGIEATTHPRYKIGANFEIYKATVADVSYPGPTYNTEPLDILWTTATSWALDGALVVTTSRRCIPVPWLQISPRTKKRGCLFCLCDHSNSAANLASDGVAIDEDGRHWYCAKRRYFVETYVPYPEGPSYGGGQYEYEWKTPSGLTNFHTDCHYCKDSEGNICDMYEDSFDNGRGECKDWAYFDERMHMCRVLDNYWQSVPCYVETYLDPPQSAIFRYKSTGTPSIIYQRKMAGRLELHPDFKTTQYTIMGAWANCTVNEGGSLVAGVYMPDPREIDGTVISGIEYSCGIGARIKPWEGSGRAAYDFVRMTKNGEAILTKPRKNMGTREVDEVVAISEGLAKIYFKQARRTVTVGTQRWTFESSGGDGFFLPDKMQPCQGENQSYGSEWGGLRKYDNIITSRGEDKITYAQCSEATAGDEDDTPQHWHLVHEVYNNSIFSEGWEVDVNQNDVDEPPPIACFSGANANEISGRMRKRDSAVIVADFDITNIISGDVATFERAGS